MEEPRDDPVHVEPLSGDLPAGSLSEDLPAEPHSGDLPAEALSNALPAEALSNDLSAVPLSNDLPVEALSRALHTAPLSKEPSASPLSQGIPGEERPPKDLPDEPPSKDTITGDTDSATVTIDSKAESVELDESSLSTETKSSTYGSVKTTHSDDVLDDDQAMASAKQSKGATVSAKDSKDTTTSTAFLSERPSCTSDVTIDMDDSPDISLLRTSPYAVSLAPTPSHERRQADELKDFRSQLFYKHDKLCLCVNGRDWDHIPEVIFDLDELRCLFVANNDLKELPNGISNLRNLEVGKREASLWVIVRAELVPLQTVISAPFCMLLPLKMKHLIISQAICSYHLEKHYN